MYNSTSFRNVLLTTSILFSLLLIVSCTSSNPVSASPGSLKVSATTHRYYSSTIIDNPRGCPVALWIQTPDSVFVKTIGLWASFDWSIDFLTTWGTVSDGVSGIPDGVTSATRRADGPVTATWDLTGQDKKPVPQGTYEFWIEFSNDSWPSKKSKGTIVIDGTSKTILGDTAGFISDFVGVYTAPK